MTMPSDNIARRVGVALLAVVAPACTSSPTAPLQRGAVTAAASASRIAVTNGTDAPVFTFTVGQRAAAVINWAPCVDVAQCPPVAPGATAEAAFPAAFQGSAEQAAVVYWWHAVRGADGALRPDSVRAIHVGL